MADEDDGMGRMPPLEGEYQTPDEAKRQEIAPIDVSVIGGLTRAEIDVQISTAHKFPRSITTVMRQIETFATLDVETATSCFFRKPQREKKKNPKTGKEEWVDGYIEGPSIRFAETVMQAWGNGRVASRVTDQTETEIEATGIFHDLESNVAWAKSVRVPIVGANGRKFPGHLITTLGNAAASKAIRNAIMAGVPRGIWNRGYQAALGFAKGDGKGLPDRRRALFAKAAEENITPSEVFAMLGVKGEADIGIDQLFDAAALLTAVRDGEATVAELIAIKQPPVDERGLAEAFGRQQPKASPTKASAARTAAPAKDTQASATAASTASPAETSGQPQPAEPSSDGEVVDPKTGEVIDLAAKRAETAAPAEEEKRAEVEQSGAGEAEGPSDDNPDVELDTAAFNAFAREVEGAGTWADLKGAVKNFRRSEAFAAAPEELQRRALVLAYNHGEQQRLMGPEALNEDVEWYRLWLATSPPKEQVRPVFRKLMRGAQYQALEDDGRDAIVAETNRAAGDL